MLRNLICGVLVALLFSACGGSGGSSSAVPAPGIQTLVVPSVSDVRLDNVNSQGIMPKNLLLASGVWRIDPTGDAVGGSSERDISSMGLLRDKNSLYVALVLAAGGVPDVSGTIQYIFKIQWGGITQRFAFNGDLTGYAPLVSDGAGDNNVVTTVITDGLGKVYGNAIIFEIPLANITNSGGGLSGITATGYVQAAASVVADSTSSVLLDFGGYVPLGNASDDGTFSSLPVYVAPLVTVISLNQSVTVEWFVGNPPVTTITETNIRWRPSTTATATVGTQHATSSPGAITSFTDSFMPTTRGTWLFSVYVTDGVTEATSTEKVIIVQ